MELLPVHHHLNEPFLLEKNLTSYWGYNTLSFLAFEPAYASAADPHAALRQFKGMAKRLHAAGMEVILDVAYNHTAEGNQLGPTLTFRDISRLGQRAFGRSIPALLARTSLCSALWKLSPPSFAEPSIIRNSTGLRSWQKGNL